jgi:hypothetical protein
MGSTHKCLIKHRLKRCLIALGPTHVTLEESTGMHHRLQLSAPLTICVDKDVTSAAGLSEPGSPDNVA